jgi:predicted nuclease of restriction endonuclease-like (RecB) superfamily
MRLFYQEWMRSEVICAAMTDKLNSDGLFLPSLTDNLIGLAKREEFAERGKIKSNVLSEFFSISFTHHYEIMLRIADEKDRWYYIQQTAINFWTVRYLRTELINQTHLNPINRSNNFEKVLNPELSNRALKVFKDQYLLDYVNIEDGDEEVDEKVLEKEIVMNIKKFLMSLGSDFSFIGNQYRVIVNEDEYFIDLLFFHRGLQALIAFELKRGKFKPEYIGKMNFYLSALDDMVRKPYENPSIGIILCKEKDQKKVEYSFRDFSKPLGVATYKTTDTLPPQLKYALPDAETLKKLLE